MKKKVAKLSQRLSCSFDHSFEFECKCLHLVATCQNFNNQDRHRQQFLSGGGGGGGQFRGASLTAPQGLNILLLCGLVLFK